MKHYILIARSLFDGNAQTFFDTEIIRLMPQPSHSPDLQGMENAWSMVGELLSRQHTPITLVDERVGLN